MKFAALGRTNWLHDAIIACAERGHEPVLIGTAEASPEYSVGPGDFRRLAERYACPYFLDAKLDGEERRRQLIDSGAAVAVSVNWPTLVPQRVFDLLPCGMLNAHAGDLPRFRGNAAPNWAILLGESRVVVTVHRMTTGLDAGDILLQSALPLAPDTYVADVYDFLSREIPRLFAETLDGLESGALVARPQSADPGDSLRGLPRKPCDGLIDWSAPAERIARLVRASAEPFAGAYTFLDGERVTVWRARAASLESPHVGVSGQVLRRDRASGEVRVFTPDGVLAVREVETTRLGRVPATDLVRSTRQRFGSVVEDDVHELQERVARLERQLRALARRGGWRQVTESQRPDAA